MSINALVRHPGRLPEEQESRANVALRPLSLDEFLGQEGLKKNLNIFIEAAKTRGGAIDHILLYGPPGLGKTTLAKIISREMGVNFLPTSGPIIHKAGDLAAILTKLSEGDILFIDEIHRLNITIEEILYPAMEDFKLDLMIGEGAAARSIRIDLPQFTLIGATTRSGLVSSPLRDRFGIQLRLDLYSIEELKKVINRACKLREIEIDELGATEIAKRSRGTPRIAGRLLRRVHDLALVMGQGLINKEMAMKSLEMLDIDINGLDSMDQKYLRTILDFYEGGPVGIETLASSLNEQKDTLEDVVEPYLLQQGFIQRTPRGRVLTAIAYDYLKGGK